jgi:phenylalanyl-tRNA synthetase beta chain
VRVALSWLREYVDLDENLDVEDLGLRLDMSGTKVEEIHRLGTGVGGVRVAEVLDVGDHPNADNLTLVEVTTGDETHRVVCGARNFAVGDRVPLAVVGAHLPGMEITERKIRGEVSRGMLCSGAELGVSKDHSGILVLPPDVPIGEDIVSVLRLDDVILELEITPNRPDCMSMIGVAREVAALYGTGLKVPDIGLQTDELESPVEIDVQDPLGCPRYLARYLEEVTVGPSPAWMAARLLAAGFRPISNIVDATNYVLLETGQPLHAFDAARVAHDTIVVRRARDGELLTTLDDEERKLDASDLLIADPEKPLAIAGVMGGVDSEVSTGTTTVIIESATFDKISVSFTSRRHNLRTEASARFERGSDPEIVPYAAARAAHFMKETGGANVSPVERDSDPVPPRRPIVTLRPDKANELLGIEIEPERQAEHLRSIGLSSALRNGSIEVEVPPFRRDLSIEADLIEEVARLEGFEKLPTSRPKGPAGGLTREQRADRTLRRALIAAGLTEAWTSSLSSPDELDALGYPPEHEARRMVELANPMLEQEPALRTTLLAGLLRSVARNFAHQTAAGVALFEMARAYLPLEELPQEPEMLTCAFAGERRPKTWRSDPESWDLYAAKGVLAGSLAALGVAAPSLEPVEEAPFHPTRGAAVMLEGARVGSLGELHPDVCDGFDVPQRTVGLEIALAPIYAALPGRTRAIDLPRFPSVLIDVAVIVDADVPADVVRGVAERAGEPELVKIRLFDLYQGDQIPEGKKSLAFSLEFRHPERTLTDEDASRVRDRIVDALREEVGGELRG